MERTLQLEVALLEDATMLDALVNCQEQVATNRTILVETCDLREHLEEKRVNYVGVATHATMLYEVIKKLQVLSPMYHVPFGVFSSLVIDTLKSRQRGKGAIGKYV